MSGVSLARAIHVISDAEGFRIAGLAAGIYNLRVKKAGFATQVSDGLEVPVNQVLVLKVVLPLSLVQEEITVSGGTPWIETTISSTGATILPWQIDSLPLNGRDYLDLMQIVPGVTINRRVNKGTDDAVPLLGERGGNTVFLVDGMPYGNAVDGGPAAAIDQDSIWNFRSLQGGTKRNSGTDRAVS